MSETHDCGGDVAAYVLGALEPAEAEAFRAHLESCVVCRDEVDALETAVQVLPMAAPQYRAPKRLRRRVLHAVRQEPSPAASERRARAAGVRARWRPRWALAALAAAVVAVATVGALELGGSGTRLIQARVAGIAGSAQLRLADGHGELIVRRLSPPPSGHVYEVWLKGPRSAPSAAGVLFSVTASGSAELGLPGSLRGIRQVLVTPEPDGGSPAPTHSPVIVAAVA